MKKVKGVKKILIIIIIIICILTTSFIVYFMNNRTFHVKEFSDIVEVNYKDEFLENPGIVCYGNKLKCKKIIGIRKGWVDTNKLGEYNVTYEYKYGKKTLTKVQTVKVVDKENPTLEVEDTEVFYSPNGTIKDYKASALDNYDGDITSSVTKYLKDGKIIFEVKDSSGNMTSLIKDAKEKDDTKPSITLNGSNVVYVKLNDKYNEQGYKAYDNCDGDITSKVKVSGVVDTKNIGEYTISYKVADESNNETIVKRTVFVYKDVNYTTPTGKSIYLTFDDGPSKYTSNLLDILKKYNVKATFFVTGKGIADGYDFIIKREYDEGHTIGLHSNTHNYNIYVSEQTYFDDLYAIQNKVKEITGYTSMIIRFPGGSSNTVSRRYDGGAHIMSYLTKKVEQDGFRYFDWNVSSNDAGGTTSTNTVINNVIKSLGNGSTYIILQHDTKGFSVDAVETIIKYGLSHGYTFKTIDTTTPTVHHTVNN